MSEIWKKGVLAHHGIKGQKWGVRRYQNEDGSLTPAGQKRYNKLTKKIEKLEKCQRKTEKTLNKRIRTERGVKRFVKELGRGFIGQDRTSLETSLGVSYAMVDRLKKKRDKLKHSDEANAMDQLMELLEEEETQELLASLPKEACEDIYNRVDALIDAEAQGLLDSAEGEADDDADEDNEPDEEEGAEENEEGAESEEGESEGGDGESGE